MKPIVAFIFGILLVLLLLSVERRRNKESSLALWVPTLWILICESRPVGRWLTVDQYDQDFVANWTAEVGSPLDRLVLSVLIILALLIIARRKIELSQLLKDNYVLIMVYSYMAISTLWSDVPYSSIKRWIKTFGDMIIALVILCERMPLNALESVFRRCAYVLIPISLVLIKFYPSYGRVYGRWDGAEMWVGVTTHKNSLAITCALAVVLIVWSLLRDWRSGELFKNKYHTFPDLLILAMAVYLLTGSGQTYSATSFAITILGITTMVMLYKMNILARFLANNLKVITIASVLFFFLFADALIGSVASNMGRDPTLTGRTDIWRVLIDAAARNPILGVGYGGFWGLGNEVEEEVAVGQAHNGYLDVYLELGIVGLVLLAAFILSYCSRIRREMSHSFDWGVYGICMLMLVLMFNYSESAIFQSSPLWSSMVLMSVVFSAPILENDKNNHLMRRIWKNN